MRGLLILVSAFVIAGCSSFPDKSSIHTLSGETIKALGHGGMGSRALIPMNSWGSLEECFQLKPDGTELDIQMTKDSVLVCYHDQKLDKTTTCSGSLADYTWLELSQGCEYYTWSSSKRFARLDSVIQKFGRTDLILSLDLKEAGTSKAHKEKMRGKILKTAIQNSNITFLIETWDSSGKWGFDETADNILFFQLCSDPQSGIEAIQKNGFDGISIDYRNLTKKNVEKLHSLNHLVMVYGANTAAGNKNAVRLSPDFIQSDRLNHLLDGLASMQ